MNGMEYDVLVDTLKTDPENSSLLHFLPSEYDVHHRDEDCSNDAVSNLCVISHAEHPLLHDPAKNFNVDYTAVSSVSSVTSVGRKRTFDIEVLLQESANVIIDEGLIVHNCGKSLVAKAMPTAWGIPLLRMDVGALRSKYVGESEANLRTALRTAEAVAPVVLWLDEIEKGLGETGGRQDGGVSADALGTILTWLQEKAGSVFVVATANDISALPPEMTRKGRFDDIFFVDLPTTAERVAIVDTTLRKHDRVPADFDVQLVAGRTEGFSGAELAELVPAGMFMSFADDKRPLATDDLLAAAMATVPISKSAAERIEALRKWSETRARKASDPETTTKQLAGGRGKTLEVEADDE